MWDGEEWKRVLAHPRTYVTKCWDQGRTFWPVSSRGAYHHLQQLRGVGPAPAGREWVANHSRAWLRSYASSLRRRARPPDWSSGSWRTFRDTEGALARLCPPGSWWGPAVEGQFHTTKVGGGEELVQDFPTCPRPQNPPDKVGGE